MKKCIASKKKFPIAQLYLTSLVYIYEKAITEVWEALVLPPSPAKFPPRFAREIKLGEGLPLPIAERGSNRQSPPAMVLFLPFLRIS